MQKVKFKFKNKRIKRIVITGISLFVVVGVVTGILVAAASNTKTSTTTFRSTQASTSSISNYLSESGTALDSAEYALTAANAGTVDSVSVSQGDTVTKGQVIAHISDTTSTEALISKQNALTTAESDLATSKESLNDLYATAISAGRIKSVKVEAGDDASAISNAYGYLMYLSISGETQVNISSPQTSDTSGDTVSVVVGTTTYSGTVSSSGGSGNSGVTITVNSDVPAIGATATVTTEGGKAVGTGTIALTSDAIKISASGSGGSGSTSTSSTTISAVYVTEGQAVSKGAKLFKYDDSSVQKEILQKEQYVTQAQNDVNNAQAAVDKDTLTSPVDGVVASLSVKTGDNVQNSGSITTMMDPNQMETTLSVDEDDISSIEVGQTANITLTAISNKTYTGKVTKVDSLGTTSNNVTTYSVIVVIDNPSGIKVGMTTNADITTASKDNVVVVSSSAVLEKQGTTGYVLKSSKLSGITKLTNISTMELVQKYGTKVTLGLSNTNEVEITSGLTDGDTVEIPVTINLAAAKSLNNTNSSNSSTMGGMPGDMGAGSMPSGGPMGGGTTTQKSGGTGNTVG